MNDSDQATTICPNCSATRYPADKICPFCDFIFVPQTKEVQSEQPPTEEVIEVDESAIELVEPQPEESPKEAVPAAGIVGAHPQKITESVLQKATPLPEKSVDSPPPRSSFSEPPPEKKTPTQRKIKRDPYKPITARKMPKFDVKEFAIANWLNLVISVGIFLLIYFLYQTNNSINAVEHKMDLLIHKSLTLQQMVSAVDDNVAAMEKNIRKMEINIYNIQTKIRRRR